MSSYPLHIVGLGPGSGELLPPLAQAALESSLVIAGYARYVELIAPEILAGKKIIRTGMMDEIGRCNAAIDAALGHDGDFPHGAPVSLVCSGDPGIYALAGLVYELAEKRGLGPERLHIRVVPGIPALCGAAALLGAPLMHDFASISLSDLLTPWELIEKRIRHALAGDFVLAVYNPRSKKRDWQLVKLLELALEARGRDGVIGLVKNAWRDGQKAIISRLSDFRVEQADMLSILFVGNSQSRILPDAAGGTDWSRGARLMTPRGYMRKYGQTD